eukprot:9478189-Pyramimonas_sp.AAC.1
MGRALGRRPQPSKVSAPAGKTGPCPREQGQSEPWAANMQSIPHGLRTYESPWESRRSVVRGAPRPQEVTRGH